MKCIFLRVIFDQVDETMEVCVCSSACNNLGV